MEKFYCWICGAIFGFGLGGLLFTTCHAAEPEQTIPYCAQAGHDCVNELKQAGPIAFCQWAANVAVIGAYQRDKGMAQLQLSWPHKRPLTANELKHINSWFMFGYQGQRTPYDTQDKAYQVCFESFV